MLPCGQPDSGASVLMVERRQETIMLPIWQQNVLLYDAGYMPEKSLAHYRTLLSIVHTLGPDRRSDADYLDACRAKRNHVEYDYVDGASAMEAEELLAFAKDLREEVVGRLAAKYPGLVR